jgi:putative phage-type endonuclease
MLTEEQKEQRRLGIGASDSGIIMGYSSYKTPYQLYLEKTGLVSDDDEPSELQYWGNEIEPLIIKRFSEKNNLEVTFPDTIYHPEYDFIFANLDGYIASENAVVEAKNANSFMRKEWDSAYQDGIPLTYLIQIAKQVAVANATKGYCAVLIGGNEYMQFVYERDRELENMIIESDKRFWNCVVTRTEPDPINTSDCRLKYKEVIAEKTVPATHRVAQQYAELMTVKANAKALAEREEQYKMFIMQHMGNAEYLAGVDGEILVTWKANKKGTRVFNIK